MKHKFLCNLECVVESHDSTTVLYDILRTTYVIKIKFWLTLVVQFSFYNFHLLKPGNGERSIFTLGSLCVRDTE